MIALDTSALVAILVEEDGSDACIMCLKTAKALAISGGTLSEALIVSTARGIREEMERLLEALRPEVVPVTGAFARLVADAYRLWGKGVHRASLNFGDCFGYALASDRRCPLLYVGEDFRRTDVVSAIPARRHSKR